MKVERLLAAPSRNKARKWLKYAFRSCLSVQASVFFTLEYNFDTEASRREHELGTELCFSPLANVKYAASLPHIAFCRPPCKPPANGQKDVKEAALWPIPHITVQSGRLGVYFTQCISVAIPKI